MSAEKKPQQVFTKFSLWLYPRGLRSYLILLNLLILLAGGGLIVYLTGGTAYPYAHILYIPIILAGFFYSIPGGLIAGFLAGLIVGPWMPLDVASAELQLLHDWLLRGGFFTTVGGLAGISSYIFRSYLREVEHRRLTNPITGLPNLRGMTAKFTTLLQQNEKLFVIVVEVRHLRKVENAFGISYAEEFLQQIALQLQRSLPDSAHLGHSQTSGFIITVPELTDVPEFIQDLRAEIQRTYQIADTPIYAEMVCGVASYPSDDRDLPQLVRKAKIALESLRGFSQSFAIYDASARVPKESNIQLLHELNQAVENEEFVLHYQPKIELATNRVIGVEALIRWQHPEHGLIPPGDFLPLAEETFLINSLTRWLFRQACQDLRTLHQDKHLLQMAVNVSIKNFHAPELFDELIKLVKASGIAPKFFEVEITESAVTPDLSSVVAILNKVRATGIQITIDDFGTGQASQSYLYELPLDGVKIDQSFVKDMTINPTAAAIVKSAILLAKDLNLAVTAEGVRTQEHIKVLKELDCTMVQGFVIARPMPLGELKGWLEKSR